LELRNFNNKKKNYTKNNYNYNIYLLLLENIKIVMSIVEKENYLNNINVTNYNNDFNVYPYIDAIDTKNINAIKNLI